eukprot:TRINITY_DN586_c0_g1_i6.p2 TRINITY_DN586_c0_g1~~TRINITY_DN586_c0_g1_i6.p2  ORF type:complete len:139 (-),score=35.94 TRINITY_DN586_c0_g1_i6:645-1061(-)
MEDPIVLLHTAFPSSTIEEIREVYEEGKIESVLTQLLDANLHREREPDPSPSVDDDLMKRLGALNEKTELLKSFVKAGPVQREIPNPTETAKDISLVQAEIHQVNVSVLQEKMNEQEEQIKQLREQIKNQELTLSTMV